MRVALLVVAALFLSGCSLGATDLRNGQTTCPVHATALKEETRKLDYGLQYFSKGYWEAEEKQFPMANTYLGAGCGVPMWPEYARIMYCDQCRTAESAWHAEHDPPPSTWQSSSPMLLSR